MPLFRKGLSKRGSQGTAQGQARAAGVAVDSAQEDEWISMVDAYGRLFRQHKHTGQRMYCAQDLPPGSVNEVSLADGAAQHHLPSVWAQQQQQTSSADVVPNSPAPTVIPNDSALDTKQDTERRPNGGS